MLQRFNPDSFKQRLDDAVDDRFLLAAARVLLAFSEPCSEFCCYQNVN